MAEKTWVKNQPSPYQLHDITHFPDWHGLVVCDAFFNNLTSGLMLAAAIAWAAGGTPFLTLLPFAMTVALLILIIDLFILVADLGDSKRFFHSLRVMRPTSALSVGVWGLSMYGIFLGAATVLTWLLWSIPIHNQVILHVMVALMKFCAVMAVVGAIVVICYKGVVFSCSSQPGLCQARWFTAFMVSDSLLMGMAVLICLAMLVGPSDTAYIHLILPMIILICIRSLAMYLVWQDVKYRARKVHSPEANRMTFLIIFVGGGIIPVILLFCGYFGIALASLLVLFAGLYERNWLIGLPKPV